MAIHFIPNDPLTQHLVPIRRKQPRPDRAANLAGFEYSGESEEGTYPEGTPDFLFWQCREAALAAVDTWEVLAGSLTRWVRDHRTLRLRQNRGDGLHAFYDRRQLAFFSHVTDEKGTFSGASTDVVAHEAGHAFLDALRPGFYQRNEPEIAAFHEAFADCVALLTALADRIQRSRVLEQSADLRSPNFLESWGEDLADGVRRAHGAQHPASKPRRLRNSFRWQLPATLPETAPPDELSNEPHSFGRVFAGCFYDTIANVFEPHPNSSTASLRLRRAGEVAGRLLVEATRRASDEPRLFHAVGQHMVFVDQQEHGGRHVEAIRSAFARHGISLSIQPSLSPLASLAGPAPDLRPRAANVLSATTRRDLARRMETGTRARLTVSLRHFGTRPVAQAVRRRPVGLGTVDPRLQGVVAYAHEGVLVGSSGSRAALLSAVPDPRATNEEVLTFVQTLLKHNCIRFGRSRPGITSTTAGPSPLPTHAIRKMGDRRVLTRIRFACACFG